MSNLPPIKARRDFTGLGHERIGDPLCGEDEGGILVFREGIFKAALPIEDEEEEEQTTPQNADEHERNRILEAAEDQAEIVRGDPGDSRARKQLKEITARFREEFGSKGAERAARYVIQGRGSTYGPARTKNRRTALTALGKASKELGRPPTGPEVVSRMKRMKDRDGSWITKGDPKDLKEIVCSLGFHWLEWPVRGHQGER